LVRQNLVRQSGDRQAADMMPKNGHEVYLQNEVLSASPLKLIQIMYSAALDSIAAARRSLRVGDIFARSRAITKAMRIVRELSRCLNREAGGELSRNLANVYAYVIQLLIESNIRQIEAPLLEAEQLLSTLAEAWTACAPAESEPVEYALRPELPVLESQAARW
jgi:flagellar protein FliS